MGTRGLYSFLSYTILERTPVVAMIIWCVMHDSYNSYIKLALLP